jgi:hypothetical protein
MQNPLSGSTTHSFTHGVSISWLVTTFMAENHPPVVVAPSLLQI